jgi:hypothetical protein
MVVAGEARNRFQEPHQWITVGSSAEYRSRLHLAACLTSALGSL